MGLTDRTLFITGASRGIGRAIALRAAQDGANVVIAAKTDKPHPTLPGNIYDAAEAVEQAGGRALAIALDVRDEGAVVAAVAGAVEHFGGIDILVNNASAISLTGTLQTPMKRYDIMFDVNLRGAFLCAQASLPHLQRSAEAGRDPHILNLSPPIDLRPKWFNRHVAYTVSKYGMSLWVLGMAEEFRDVGIAINALWPRSVINTSALAVIPGIDRNRCRDPRIVADAAHAILCRPSRACSGNFFIDEDVLRQEGVTDFDPYAVSPGTPLLSDLFLD